MRPTNWPSSPAVASREPPDELGHYLGEALVASLGPAVLNRDIAPFYPTKFAQALNEGGSPLPLTRRRALP